MSKAPIKIPKLYPTETIEIEGNKIELRGYKAADRPYVIMIEKIQKDMPRIFSEINKLQTELEQITADNEGGKFNDEELREKGLLDRVLEITEEITDLKLKIDEVGDKLIYGDLDSNNDEMNGPGYLLAQRGLKRFYYPNKTSSELDEIEDIEIARQHVMLIANTIISLSNPPQGLQQSIREREKEERANDKGKSGGKGGRKTSRSRKK